MLNLLLLCKRKDKNKYKVVVPIATDIRDKTHAKTFGGVGFDLPAKNTQRSREQGELPDPNTVINLLCTISMEMKEASYL